MFDSNKTRANALLAALRLAWNIDRRAVFIAGLMPWAAEPEVRMWRASDDTALNWWLTDQGVTCSGLDGLLSQRIFETANLCRYLPAAAPLPAVIPKLAGARWRVKCPYCRGSHSHRVNGSGLPEVRANSCGARHCHGARGYILSDGVMES